MLKPLLCYAQCSRKLRQRSHYYLQATHENRQTGKTFIVCNKIFPGKYFSRLPALAPRRMIIYTIWLETAMQAIPIKRFVAWLLRPLRPEAASPGRTNSTSASILEFDPFWHGDHWQNLLASPMDARHYVMEDWALPLDDDEVDYPRGEDKQRGRRRMRG